MISPGARSLLKLSPEGTEQRRHLRGGTAGMLDQHGILQVQLLQLARGSLHFPSQIAIGVVGGGRWGRLSATMVSQLREAGAEVLLAGNAVFEFGEVVAGNGLHRTLDFARDGAEEREMLLSVVTPGLGVSPDHFWLFPGHLFPVLRLRLSAPNQACSSIIDAAIFAGSSS